MIFAFLPPYIAHLIWDGCRKKILQFVGLDGKHGCVSKHIILRTNIYEFLQQKITNKCRRIGSKQIYFVCSMTSQVTLIYYLLLNSLVNC